MLEDEGMTKTEKVVYILKVSLHDLPNDKTLDRLANVIIETIEEHED